MRQVQTLAPSPEILILNADPDVGYVLELLKAGATGYLIKDEDLTGISTAVRTVARGETWLSASVATSLVDHKVRDAADTPGGRQLEILRLMVEGKTNQEKGTAISYLEQWGTPIMTARSNGHAHAVEVVHDRSKDNQQLEACLDLMDAPSLVELERRLDGWLAQLYAPWSWSVTCCVDGNQDPVIELQGEALDYPDLAAEEVQSVSLAFQSGPRIQGRLELLFGPGQTALPESAAGLSQLARALASRAHHLYLELRSLTQATELSFVRPYLHIEAAAQPPTNLDELATALLGHLGPSSVQVLIRQSDPDSPTWGIASQRPDLALPIEQRHRLLQLAEAAFRQTHDGSHGYLLVQDSQLQDMQQEYDLPYLAKLRSLCVVPICSGDTWLGAIVIGEQRSWVRQPIPRRVISVCTMLARSIAESVKQQRLLGELVEQGHFMQGFIESLDDAVLATKDSSIILWNQAAHDLFGHRAEEVLGKPLAHVLPDVPPELCNGSAIVESPDASKRSLEWTTRTSDGREQFMLATAMQLRNLGSGTQTMMYMVKEISQACGLENLTKEVVASVSHELRAPLQSIYGFSQLLLERPYLGESMRRELLESLQASTERLKRLVDDFLNVAQARRRRLSVKLERVDIVQVIRSALREIMVRHLTHRIALRTQKVLPAVRADSFRIEQILNNLVSNAAKYSPEGTRITISVRRRSDVIAISVSDHGYGMPKDVQARVFEPFYRADNSHNRTECGVGLGLSIVKSFVEAHGGQVMVRSILERGTTFTFTLPIITEHAPP